MTKFLFLTTAITIGVLIGQILFTIANALLTILSKRLVANAERRQLQKQWQNLLNTPTTKTPDPWEEKRS